MNAAAAEATHPKNMKLIARSQLRERTLKIGTTTSETDGLEYESGGFTFRVTFSSAALQQRRPPPFCNNVASAKNELSVPLQTGAASAHVGMEAWHFLRFAASNTVISLLGMLIVVFQMGMSLAGNMIMLPAKVVVAVFSRHPPWCVSSPTSAGDFRSYSSHKSVKSRRHSSVGSMLAKDALSSQRNMMNTYSSKQLKQAFA